MRSLSFMRKKEKYIRKLVEPGIPYFGEGSRRGNRFYSWSFCCGSCGGSCWGNRRKDCYGTFLREWGRNQKKYLSKRESARIGIVAVYAMNRINSNIKNNIQIRKDDFFCEKIRFSIVRRVMKYLKEH